MSVDFSLSEFLVTVMPTKDVADILGQGTKVEDFESKDNEEEQKKIEDEEPDNLDIFLDKEATGIETPKKKRKIAYLSPIPEGSKESLSDDTPTKEAKIIIVPDPKTSPKKVEKNFCNQIHLKK